MAIAYKINEIKNGPFAGVFLSVDQLKELRMAAWLHDIGKITTPEQVIDKTKKLETVYGRINEIIARIEVIKKDYLMTSGAAVKSRTQSKFSVKNIQQEIKSLDEDRQYLEKMNTGLEYIDEKEKRIVTNHAVVTKKMLSQLPFPNKMRRIAQYASAHHEKLDGSGYPSGLKGDSIPLQSRIIVIADIFEVITAKDRPYKKGESAIEAIKIMRDMAKRNHIDADLLELFVKEKIYDVYINK